MNDYIIYWRDGRTTAIHGNTPADAFNRHGYGAGALSAVDFYAKGTEPAYTWNAERHMWSPINPD